MRIQCGSGLKYMFFASHFLKGWIAALVTWFVVEAKKMRHQVKIAL
jgi:hypothetical protein